MHKRLNRNRGQLPISAPSTPPDRRQSPRTGTACRAPAMPNEPNYHTAPSLPAFPCPNMSKQTQLSRPQAKIPPYRRIYESPRTGTACRAPTMQNEPNSRTGTASRAPTMRNKPNYRTAGVSPASPSHIMQNKPNSTKPTAKSQHPTAKKCETNPIYRAASILPASHPHLLRETNPIPAPPGSRQPNHPPIMENEPSSRTAAILQALPSPHRRPQPLCAKRTQFPVPPPYRWRLAGFPTPHCGKRTQFPPLASPILRNEPNSTKPTAKSQLPTPNSQKMRNEPNPPHNKHPLTSVQERSYDKDTHATGKRNEPNQTQSEAKNLAHPPNRHLPAAAEGA